jgi:undecaprenyl-diphosphatase
MPSSKKQTLDTDARSRQDPSRPRLKPLSIGLSALLLLLCAALLWGAVAKGETTAVDNALLQAALHLRTAQPWVAHAMRDLSGLGSTIVLTLFTLATVAYLVIVSAPRQAMLVTTSIVSGTLLVDALKSFLGRSRPDSEYAELVTSSLSFPSGHASMSALVFLTLATLVAGARSRRREQLFILGAAALLALLVGVSRVILGVHWASDVLGGWALGTAWAMLWLLLARRLGARPGRSGEDRRREG